MKKTLALVLALCMAMSLCAVSAFADDEFVVNACIASEPETIDPATISSVDGSTYVQHIH